MLDQNIGSASGSPEKFVAPLTGGLTEMARSAERRKIQFNYGVASIESVKHPDRNEDSPYIDKDNCSFGVFDGVGGAKYGEVASQVARQTFRDQFGRLSSDATLEVVEAAMKQALEDANRAVIDENGTRGLDGIERMGTTAVIGHIWTGPNGEHRLIIGKVGDSRIYRFRAGRLSQLTIDDNIIRNKLIIGALKPTEADDINALFDQVTGIDDPRLMQNFVARDLWGHRNEIYNNLGDSEPLGPEMSVVDIEPGDSFLACSDGVHDNLTVTEINDIMEANPDLKAAAEALKTAAYERSKDGNVKRSKADDITAIVVSLEGNQPVTERTRTESGTKLTRGSQILVKRSDGTVEDGWTIESFDGSSGDAIAINREGTLEKSIAREALIPSIAGCQTYPELISVLQSLKQVGVASLGSTTNDLELSIRDVWSGSYGLETITSQLGLRAKVAELMALRNN